MFGLVSQVKYNAVIAENSVLRHKLTRAEDLIRTLQPAKKAKKIEVTDGNVKAARVPVSKVEKAVDASSSTTTNRRADRAAKAKEMLATGSTTKEIAETLEVSVSTVSRYLK